MGKRKVNLDINVFDYETKLLFLDSITNSSSNNAYKSMLIQMSKYEKEIGKNFYDMSINEAKNCIDTLTRTTINASSTLLSKLASYLFWANANNFTENTELLSWMKALRGRDIVSKVAMENQYITKVDLYDIAKMSRNYQNQALIVLLFHGIEGIEMSELRYIKESDIDFNNNLIHLTGYTLNKKKVKKFYKRDVQLTNEEMEFIKDAINQTSYYEIKSRRKRGKTEAKDVSVLIESEYLFKNTEFTKNRTDGSNPDIVARSILTARIREVSLEANKILNAGNIIMSGQIYELTQLKKNFEDITDEDYVGILKKYNKTINLSSINTLKELYKYLLDNEIKVAVSQ